MFFCFFWVLSCGYISGFTFVRQGGYCSNVRNREDRDGACVVW